MPGARLRAARYLGRCIIGMEGCNCAKYISCNSATTSGKGNGSSRPRLIKSVLVLIVMPL